MLANKEGDITPWHRSIALFRFRQYSLHTVSNPKLNKLLNRKPTVLILTEMTGIVRRPQAKNSRNMTTKAWYTLGSPMPEL